MTAPVAVRAMRPPDAAVSSRLHEQVLSMEFLARCGLPFLYRYHRAWIASPHAMALAAVDGGDVVGVLLGSLDPEAHVRSMVRRDGLALASSLAAHALTHPDLARELVATRGTRYLRGLGRVVVTPRRRRAAPRSSPAMKPALVPVVPRVGEVTHLLVRVEHQGRGVGKALLGAAQAYGAAAGLTEFVIVTPPDLPARGFYQHLGWVPTGSVVSRSGEGFVRYHYPLDA